MPPESAGAEDSPLREGPESDLEAIGTPLEERDGRGGRELMVSVLQVGGVVFRTRGGHAEGEVRRDVLNGDAWRTLDVCRPRGRLQPVAPVSVRLLVTPVPATPLDALFHCSGALRRPASDYFSAVRALAQAPTNGSHGY